MFPKGTFNDLYDTIKHFTLDEVFDCATKLGVMNQMLRTNTGCEVSIADICCIEGAWKPARDSNRYYFYGGPEMVITEGNRDAFTLIYGTVLDWLIDSILFQMTYRGWEVTQKLGLPL